MPKLWSASIDAHRRAVRESVLDAAAELVADHGLTGVTMSGVAARTGIGRATLYKYFPDVAAIVLAWHERQVAEHVQRLIEARDRSTDPGRRLRAVLETYAAGLGREHGAAAARHLHTGGHVTRASRELAQLVTTLLADAARSGDVRDDIAAEELAAYCLAALAAAAGLPSDAAVRRLVAVVLDGLRPPGAVMR